ncbi:EpsG family protein (plasmid) [Sulfitobacter sp. OXR-159]|uniref:EpsG family protein n=1 Tax=Sulfitobacter sp. OXR-159 TaxID=3100174 RepID=UPI002AC96579|nr:EpsG family protein [Sulfitobacter sp. OXR-159]WPZ31534.1 EpsG family protein [Sulfitobacter sp. OXR-159]
MVYFGLANMLFLLRYALNNVGGRGRREVYYVVLLSLFLFSAFRFQVGCDWSGYYYQYLGATDIDWQLITAREPAWWALLGSIKALGFPYPVANIASSAIFFIGIHVLARRQLDPLGFLVLLFPILIINMPMSGIRQGAAIGLICIAFTAFIDRRRNWFAIWVFVAAGFHSSALVFLLLFPLATGRYTKSRLSMAVVLAIPGVALLAGGESAEIATSRYIGSGAEAFGAVFRVGILGLSALYFFWFVRKKWMPNFSYDYSLVSIGAIGMMLTFLLLPVSTIIADRFGYYFIPIQTMIFARLPYLPFKFNPSLHTSLPYLGLLVVFFVWTQISGHFNQCYIPYQSWIFGFPGGDLLDS